MLLLYIVLISIEINEFYIHKKHFEFMNNETRYSNITQLILPHRLYFCGIQESHIAVSFNNDILLGSGESWTRFKLNTSQPRVLQKASGNLSKTFTTKESLQ